MGYNKLMDKKLLKHERFIKAEITKFENKLKDAKTESETKLILANLDELCKYHNETIHNFQHERLIHLIVTFFFGGLLLLSIAAVFLFTLLPDMYSYAVNYSILLICSILFITEIFYVRHYYTLENGTQRLYELSKKLFEFSRLHKNNIDI